MKFKAGKTFSLLCFFVGLIAGAVLFASFSFKWLYKIDKEGRYLTFDQPRKSQAFSKLYHFKPNPKRLQIILFGGSSAHHAINDFSLSKLLSEKFKQPVEVRLISFDDQTLLDSYEFIAELPELTGRKVYVFDLWSFWRVTGRAVNSVKSALSWKNKLFISTNSIALLQSGILPRPSGYSSWSAVLKSRNLLSKDAIFSTWLKYFLLDKLQKLQRGTPPRFFMRDSYEINPHENSEDLSRLLKVLHTQDQIKARQSSMKRLSRVYAPQNQESAARFLFHANTFMMSKKIAERKGYDYAVLELPVYQDSWKNKAIAADIVAMRRALDNLPTNIKHIDYTHPDKNFVTNFDYWWDLVHMTQVGKRAYMPYLANVIFQTIKGGSDDNTMGKR